MSYKRNYKFKPSDNFKVWNLIKWEEGYQVFTNYHSDAENHPADPHNRYVIIYTGPGSDKIIIDDVCEKELEFQEEE